MATNSKKPGQSNCAASEINLRADLHLQRITSNGEPARLSFHNLHRQSKRSPPIMPVYIRFPKLKLRTASAFLRLKKYPNSELYRGLTLGMFENSDCESAVSHHKYKYKGSIVLFRHISDAIERQVHVKHCLCQEGKPM
jgi:hypothetical protein